MKKVTIIMVEEVGLPSLMYWGRWNRSCCTIYGSVNGIDTLCKSDVRISLSFDRTVHTALFNND